MPALGGSDKRKLDENLYGIRDEQRIAAAEKETIRLCHPLKSNSFLISGNIWR